MIRAPSVRRALKEVRVQRNHSPSPLLRRLYEGKPVYRNRGTEQRKTVPEVTEPKIYRRPGNGENRFGRGFPTRQGCRRLQTPMLRDSRVVAKQSSEIFRTSEEGEGCQPREERPFAYPFHYRETVFRRFEVFRFENPFRSRESLSVLQIVFKVRRVRRKADEAVERVFHQARRIRVFAFR